jgi:hypothetical protein
MKVDQLVQHRQLMGTRHPSQLMAAQVYASGRKQARRLPLCKAQ